MTTLTWDDVGDRLYETGLDRGVLFIPNGSGVYDAGVSWNGLTTVTESPSGAEASAQYADNTKYLNLLSAEEFGATIEAFTYPDEFAEFDGLGVPIVGVAIGQQSRKSFGFCYRTLVGNDVDGTDHGYKLHFVYGASAAPSEKGYTTVNDSPEAIALSWEITTIPVSVTGFKPTSLIVVDSTKVDSTNLAALEQIVYGTVGVDPRMPLPDEIVSILTTTPTTVSTGGANTPTYDSGTHTITFPTVTGVQWKVDGVNKAGGTTLVLTTGQTKVVTATPTTGYILSVTSDDDWIFSY